MIIPHCYKYFNTSISIYNQIKKHYNNNSVFAFLTIKNFNIILITKIIKDYVKQLNCI